MLRPTLAALALTSACAFTPAGDGAAATDDAAPTTDARSTDGPALDAAIDARPIDAPPPCPGDYVGGYRLIPTAQSWRAAEADCEDDTTGLSHLVVIDNAGELAAVNAALAALAIKEATLGPTHVGLASTLGNLAAVMAEQGEVEASLPLLARVIALVEATDAMSPRLIDPLVNLALAELELGRPTAPATTTRLVAVALRAAGDGGRADPSMFFPLVLAGWATLEAGDPRGAVRALAPLLAHPGYADAMAGDGA